MVRSDQPRIAILGAGPIGIEAALYARQLKLPVTVYERGRVGEHLHRWGHVRLFSPFGMNVTSLGSSQLDHSLPASNECITGHEHVEAYLNPLAEQLQDCIELQTEVLHLGRRQILKHHLIGDPKRGKQPFILYLRNEGQERIEEADVVLDCTGTYSQPRRMGEGGIPALGELALQKEIAYSLVDVCGEKKSEYLGKTTLILGGGYSAATTVCQLAKLAEEDDSTWIVWLARTSNSQPIKRIANDPLKERDRLAMRANTLATRAEGNVEFYSQCVVESVSKTEDGYEVRGRIAGRERTWEAEKIIANVGFTPDTNLYRELQVHECYASLGPMKLAASLLKQSGADCLTVGAQGAETLRNPEPGFFILGNKSYGRGSNFLLRTGFEQIREVFTLITGRKNLNLYR